MKKLIRKILKEGDFDWAEKTTNLANNFVNVMEKHDITDFYNTVIEFNSPLNGRLNDVHITLLKEFDVVDLDDLFEEDDLITFWVDDRGDQVFDNIDLSTYVRKSESSTATIHGDTVTDTYGGKYKIINGEELFSL